MRILIVDDEALARERVSRIVGELPDHEVVGEAENGQVALDKVGSLNPDVILLDIEMPIMDGITALPLLMDKSPDSRVIMVSTLTLRNAAISIKALSLGAVDYIEKPSANTDKEEFKKDLVSKVSVLSAASRKSHHICEDAQEGDTDVEQSKPAEIKVDTRPIAGVKPLAIAIGCSTGGPQALTKFFEDFDHKIKDIPIFITQHMPPAFTTFLADSLGKVSSMDCVEGESGMEIKSDKIYLAPGDYHMTVKSKAHKGEIQLNQDEPENFCRPAVDPMLRSLSKVYGEKLLVVILTGMGQDGLEGCKEVVKNGGTVIAQDEKSSIVWGMPGAVVKEKLSSGVYPLDAIAERVVEICKGGA